MTAVRVTPCVAVGVGHAAARLRRVSWGAVVFRAWSWGYVEVWLPGAQRWQDAATTSFRSGLGWCRDTVTPNEGHETAGAGHDGDAS